MSCFYAVLSEEPGQVYGERIRVMKYDEDGTYTSHSIEGLEVSGLLRKQRDGKIYISPYGGTHLTVMDDAGISFPANYQSVQGMGISQINELGLTAGTISAHPYRIKFPNQSSGIAHRRLGYKHYELTDHLGNVRAVVSDRLALQIPFNYALHQPEVLSYTNYYPFGMLMPNRVYGSNSYSWGFQGQLKDDEIKGPGNSINFKYRMHDPRLGRFFAVDPLASKYPYNSPYAFSENDVIRAVELEGLEKSIIINNSLDGYQGKIHILTGEKVQNAGTFTAFATLMKDIGLLDNNTDLHFKHTGASQSYDGSDVNFSANYKAIWQFRGQTIRMDMSVPIGSVHITGSSPIDYPLALIGSGLYSQMFKTGLRPLYNQAATNIKSTALGLLNSGKYSSSAAARFANTARNNLKMTFLKSTPNDLRNLIFKYNEARGLNKWGTKTYEQLSKTKSDMQIIGSAANPQPSLKAVGESIYKALGDEAATVLEKYNIMPK